MQEDIRKGMIDVLELIDYRATTEDKVEALLRYLDSQGVRIKTDWRMLPIKEG